MNTISLLALALLPLLSLRGRELVQAYATLAALLAARWVLHRRGYVYDEALELTALAVLGVVVFSILLAHAKRVRFSAGRAALLAGIVYAAAIPAMLVHQPDGDEPYYLALTDSIAEDFDLDLRNQYREAGREPQFGDPVGENGEQYSRHEPFLSLLLVPGVLLAGLPGALVTIALFGVLLVRSTVRWMEDEGIEERVIRAVFPFFALAPPVLFYATRVWPEVPAAFFFVEAIRGVRAHRASRLVPAILGLVLLKLRFVLVGLGLLAAWLWTHRGQGGRLRSPRMLLLIAGVVVVPLALLAVLTGDATSVHTWREIRPEAAGRYVRGFFGLLTEGMSGFLFRAPFYLLGLFALVRWKETPRGFRIGLLASLLYLFYLIPRPEWFGGWAPPLRYVVFLTPVLALGAAAMWDRISRGAIALIAAWTAGLVVHGLRYPWRHFHEFTGENPIGEWLSQLYRSDFSRLFPSFIRANEARWIGVAAVAFLITIGLRRWKIDLVVPLASLAIAFGFAVARTPASIVEFEDTHVLRDGGKLYPDRYTIMRTEYRGGWVLETGNSLSFLAQQGTYSLEFITGLGATIEVGGRAVEVKPRDTYQRVTVTLPETGRATLRCLGGAINIDRMERVASPEPARP